MKIFATCKLCDSLIIFARATTGTLLPVNIASLTNEEVTKHKSGKEISFRYGTHISHFATCPDAAKFRKVKQ